MSNKMNDLKEEFLQELSEATDNIKEETKQYIGIKESNKNISQANIYGEKRMMKIFKNYKKPLIFGLSFVMVCLIAVITVVVIINYQNTPVYKEMTATNSEQVVRSKSKRMRFGLDDEGDILDQIGISQLPGISCYANPEEEIIITIKIDNPKSFEILSFTLNEYKYQTYQFEYGSDSNQILVKFKTGGTSGIQTITIDAIKYVDGETIRDVRFSGDRTIKVGVTYQNEPNVTDVNGVSSLTNYGISLVVNDLDFIIDSESGLMMYLFEGKSLLRTDKINIGSTLLPYSNLKLGQEYSIFVIGVYDLLDGEGKKGHVLYQYTFTTDEGFSFKDPVMTYDSATISLDRTNNFTGSLVKMEIYKDDELLETQEANDNLEFTFSNLLSNNEYKVVATYEYTIKVDGVDEVQTTSIETVVKTEERPDPTVNVNEANTVITKDGVQFVFDINDTATDEGEIYHIALYHLDGNNETLIENPNYIATENKFSELLSNNNYKIYATYKYDKLDGNGEQEMTIEYTFKTLPLEVPYGVLDMASNFFGNAIINFTIKDNDNILKPISFQLYKKENETDTEYSVLAFEKVWDDSIKPITKEDGSKTGSVTIACDEDCEYQVVFVYEYDLNDGNGSHLINHERTEIDDYPQKSNKIIAVVVNLN